MQAPGDKTWRERFVVLDVTGTLNIFSAQGTKEPLLKYKLTGAVNQSDIAIEGGGVLAVHIQTAGTVLLWIPDTQRQQEALTVLKSAAMQTAVVDEYDPVMDSLSAATHQQPAGREDASDRGDGTRTERPAAEPARQGSASTEGKKLCGVGMVLAPKDPGPDNYCYVKKVKEDGPLAARGRVVAGQTPAACRRARCDVRN